MAVNSLNLFPGMVLDNKLYESNFFNNTLPSLLPDVSDWEEQYTYCQELFETHKNMDNYHENQLEDELIKPILKKMGWILLPQEVKIIAGQQHKVDVALFSDNEKFLAHQALTKEQRYAVWDGISVLVESKVSTQALDTKRVNKGKELLNPYYQLLDYLKSSRIDYGFLTNGRQWWLVDNSVVTSHKRYLAFYLDEILQSGAKEEFELFWRIFHVANFSVTSEQRSAPIGEVASKDYEARIKVEDDLRVLIYGEGGQDSIFEDIGRCLFEASKHDTSPDNLQKIFENSLYFIFRLIFIAYFESRHGLFLKTHEGYPGVALWKVFEGLQHGPQDKNQFNGWYNLKLLFKVLDQGEPDLSMPILNGGLFDPDNAPLLDGGKVFSDYYLHRILKMLLYDKNERMRDFSALSISHLGTIYEGLLEFEFRLAEESLEYISVKLKDGIVEGYYDSYDRNELNKSLKNKSELAVLRKINKNDFYLASSQNSRKTSGSYYTPEALAHPLVVRAVAQQMEGPFKNGRSLLEMRILDSACGSGHILIEALNVLTMCALDSNRLAQDHLLQKSLEEEREKMEANLLQLGMEPEKAGLDEAAVLKRILLKKVIYGVDLSPFAVELAQLSLWIDTFIFGTPLSFIGHHLKCGNSLMGTDIATAAERHLQKKPDESKIDLTYKGTGLAGTLKKNKVKKEKGSLPLLAVDSKKRIDELKAELTALSALNDSNKEDIEASKKQYNKKIIPLLEKLNWYLDIVNHNDLLLLDETRKTPLPPLESLAMEKDQVCEPGYPELVDKLKKDYGFFNWEIEFPEAFNDLAASEKGFHLIIGNPPWDKTKFEDPLFFAQYRSNYRRLSNSAKQELADNLLAKPYIKAKYERESSFIKLSNAYYKKYYPLNEGAGDSNLFRFFVERNLQLLAQGGSLNYVLPTGLLIEDGSTKLRKHILENYRLNYFAGFENRKKIFPEVDSRYKFGLMQLEKVPDAGQKAKTRFMMTDAAELDLVDFNGFFDYSLAEVKSISPEHWAYMEVAGGPKDFALLRRMYGLYASLNPDWFNFRNELHATGDKLIFKEERSIGDLPLYKGAGIWQYDANYNEYYGKPEYWLNPKEFDAYLADTEINRLIADIYPSLKVVDQKQTKVKTVLNVLGLNKKEELKQFVKPDRNYLRLGFRGIARDTDERSLITALLPRNIGAQHSMFISIPKKYILFNEAKYISIVDVSLLKLLLVQVFLNSLIVDWMLRASVGMNISKTYLMRLPLPQPSDEELQNNPIYRRLVRDSALLSLYNTPALLAEIKDELGIQDSELIKTKKQFDLKQAGLDIIVAKLYGLNFEDMEHLLKSFKVLNNKKPEYVAAVLNLAKEELPFIS